MAKVKAVFTGRDGSRGYKTNVEYTLHIRQPIRYIEIEKEHGGGKCAYASVVSFLENWNHVRKC
jgi:hypothetical protein